jgi:hypothetical protein
MSPANDAIVIKIQSLGGEVCRIDTSLGTTLTDVKAQIQKLLGHSPWSQRLLLGEAPLVNSNGILADLGISADCTLTLVLVQEPLGQSSLKEPNGKKESILESFDEGVRDRLSEFEFMSWQAVCEAHKVHTEELFMEWSEDFGDFGAFGADLYWKTCSDGCRYEYWSSAPGDNEYGVLVRVDNNSMVAIGMGSDDGLEVFAEIAESDVVNELIRTGWPRPQCWKRDGDSDEDDDEDEDYVEETC